MPLPTGRVLNNRYRIDNILGQGGFGAVYRAWDGNLERVVAIKENMLTGEDAQRQFRNEALFLSGLSHENLPRVLDYFIESGEGQYLVMEFVDGQDLSKIVEQAGGPVPVEQALDWIGQTCDALNYLHTRQPPIIHRDIKPNNIRVTRLGRAMLVDFGIAKVFDTYTSTTVGARAVTPGYSPPEQYGRGKTDIQSDIYALGATLYTLLTGRTPKESIDIMLDPSLSPPPAHVFNPRVPPAVSFVVERAMKAEKGERCHSATEFKQALLNAYRSSVVPEPPPETLPVSWEPTIKVPTPVGNNKQKIWASLMVGGGLILLFAYLAGIFQPPRIENTPTAPLIPTELPIEPTVPSKTDPAPSITENPAVTIQLTDTLSPPIEPSGTIAFHSDRGGNFDIYIIGADGKGLRQLTKSVSKDMYASWSPDGNRLAFQSNADGDFDIYVMDPKTQNQVKLTNNRCADYAPTFSPDGGMIVYYSDCAGNREIFAMRSDGSQPKQLTLTPGDFYSWYPFWSRNGAWIYFSSNQTGKYWIYRMDSNGDGVTRLVRGCSGVPSWTDDRLVYQEFCLDQSSIFISDSDGNGEQMIKDGSRYDYRDPSWSPDGKWLVYRSNLKGDYDLFILELHSGEWRTLTSGAGNDHGPSWTAAKW